MAGFYQIWSSSQLQQGASGCPQHIGITGANTQAIIVENNSDLAVVYTSDIDPSLTILPRTGVTIPVGGNVQWTLQVSGTPTTNTDQVVIVSETTEPLPFRSTGVNIIGSPTVNFAPGQTVEIAGTPTVQFAPGQTVEIVGVPTVDIGGTPTVNIAAGQSVDISGTPTVQFAAGQSVDIAAGTIDIQNVANGTIQAATGLRYLGAIVAGGAAVNFPLQAGERTVVAVSEPASGFGTTATVVGHVSGLGYGVPLDPTPNGMAVFFIPDALDTSVDCSANSSTGAPTVWFFADQHPMAVTIANQPVLIGGLAPRSGAVSPNQDIPDPLLTDGAGHLLTAPSPPKKPTGTLAGGATVAAGGSSNIGTIPVGSGIKRFVWSADCAGTSIGAARANVAIVIADGTVNYVLAVENLPETAHGSGSYICEEPIIPPNLGGTTWTVTIVNTALLGAASIDCSIELDYV